MCTLYNVQPSPIWENTCRMQSPQPYSQKFCRHPSLYRRYFVKKTLLLKSNILYSTVYCEYPFLQPLPYPISYNYNSLYNVHLSSIGRCFEQISLKKQTLYNFTAQTLSLNCGITGRCTVNRPPFIHIYELRVNVHIRVSNTKRYATPLLTHYIHWHPHTGDILLCRHRLSIPFRILKHFTLYAYIHNLMELHL